jgi:SOUL heme-binding protein
VRRYRPFLVAEVRMGAGAGPASGAGFNDLAGYIFGGNNRRGLAGRVLFFWGLGLRVWGSGFDRPPPAVSLLPPPSWECGREPRNHH